MPRVTGTIYIGFDSENIDEKTLEKFKQGITSKVDDEWDFEMYQLAERCGFEINSMRALSFYDQEDIELHED